MQGNGLDLSALDTKKGAEEGFRIELRHPKTNEPLVGWWIHVLGSDSDTYQNQLREFQRLRADVFKRNMRVTYTPEERENEGLELLAAATRGWSDKLMLDGAPLQFSQDAAKKLYARFPWIKEQVDAAVADRANFLPGNGTSS